MQNPPRVQSDAAEEMYLRSLTEREKVAGVIHASTLNTVNSLGLLYADQAKLDAAEVVYVRALPVYGFILSLDHTSTIQILMNIGTLMCLQRELGLSTGWHHSHPNLG